MENHNILVWVACSNGCIVILVFGRCFHLPTTWERCTSLRTSQVFVAAYFWQQNMSNETEVAPHSCFIQDIVQISIETLQKPKQGGQCCTWACWPPPSPTGFKPLDSSLKWKPMTRCDGSIRITKNWMGYRFFGNYFGSSFHQLIVHLSGSFDGAKQEI